MRQPTGIAWLAHTARAAMLAEAERVFPNETGGVLLGYWAVPGREVVITTAIGPGPQAVHEVRRFVPDADYQEFAIARSYATSGRIDGYLGDWHTHPGGRTRLSHLDEHTLRSIGMTDAARTAIPLMAILAGSTIWRLKVWRYDARRAAVSLIRPVVAPLRVKFFEIGS